MLIYMSPLPKSIYNLEGWCDIEKSEKLYELVIKYKPKISLEIGVFGGRSYIPMALAHKKNNYGKCIGIDPWCKNESLTNYKCDDVNYKWWDSINYEKFYQLTLNAIIRYDVSKYTEIIRDNSLNVYDKFTNESIDIIHQDGNHSEATSYEEVLRYSSKLKRGGCWIMDDTNWDTTAKAQQLLTRKGFTLYEDHKEWRMYKKI